MTAVDAFLANCRLADGRLVDIGISGGKIAVIGEGAAALSNTAPALDIGGDLVLPGLVDGHMHLDKTLTGLPWMGHAAGPTRMSRIETDKTILPHRSSAAEARLVRRQSCSPGWIRFYRLPSRSRARRRPELPLVQVLLPFSQQGSRARFGRYRRCGTGRAAAIPAPAGRRCSAAGRAVRIANDRA